MNPKKAKARADAMHARILRMLPFPPTNPRPLVLAVKRALRIQRHAKKS